MAEDMVRLRLVFEDRRMLSKSQKLEGLKQSWLLLSPQQHTTISDLTSHLLHIFDLYDSCPNGLTLSLDGFIFPPFESTCILKDKDIICVKRMRGTLSDIIKIADGSNSFEEDEIVEKQPVHTGTKLLANEEFEKEAGYQSDSENDERDERPDMSPQNNALGRTGDTKKRKERKEPVHTGVDILANEESEKETGGYGGGEYEPVDSFHGEKACCRNGKLKKRKATKKLESSKRKKKCSALPKDVKNEAHSKQLKKSHKKFHPRKSLPNKQEQSAVKGQLDTSNTLETTERSIEPEPGSSLCAQLQENATRSVDLSNATTDSIKLPSRSARRKKAKRKWLRELAKVEKEEVKRRQGPDNEVHRIGTERQQQEQSCGVEDDVVPVVIRPGHIRFESIEEEQVVQPNQVPGETFQWNGITSKKKGQKWGTEKFSSPSYKDFANREYSEVPAPKEVITVNNPGSVDFDELSHLVGSPKEGDVVAYRLLELSSSWTPELSSFRVGKTSSYDPESNKIVLAPVPEYPIIFKENLDEDGSVLTLDTSSYREDGSLEIDFTSLLDVRVIKHGSSLPVKELANGPPAGNQDVSDAMGVVNNKETDAPIAENGQVNGWDETSQVLSAKKVQVSEVDGWNKKANLGSRGTHAMHAPMGSAENGGLNVWDEISEALGAKKAQLSKEDAWNKEANSGRSPWSYRAMRRSALGPQMAILRMNNEL